MAVEKNVSCTKSTLFDSFHLIIATPQINLYHTDWVDEIVNVENDTALQHNCLRIGNDIEFYPNRQEIVSYCMSELPSNFVIENVDSTSKFTFDELSKQNITIVSIYTFGQHRSILLNVINSI